MFPLTIFIALKKNINEDKIRTPAIKFQFGFLYYAFKKKYVFWEIVIILRKILLTLTTALFAE